MVLLAVLALFFVMIILIWLFLRGIPWFLVFLRDLFLFLSVGFYEWFSSLGIIPQAVVVILTGLMIWYLAGRLR